MSDNPTQSAYDRVAEEYARRMLHELDTKPRDRMLLEQFARKTAGKGRVADLGTGPGQIARYLHDHGVDAFGIDLSPAMVELARREHPGMEFQQGDMRALPLPDNSLVGITAFYCIIHIPRPEVVAALKEIRRVLQPGGLLLMSFHRGEQIVHRDEWWGETVSVDFIFFERDEMVGYLEAAGFTIEEVVERNYYPDSDEAQTQRVYIFATKPVNG
ncbi:MAG: methyltransferase domain-containing protein [Chloroflexi bacterium]|nr:methyltransferase domain-containing protein [Chloroflexota bacterium]